MDTGYLLLISITVTVLLIFVQRTEKSKRRIAWTFAIISFLVIRHNAFIKGNLHEETLLGFVIGIVFGSLFWLLVGKYNPVGTSDNIQVIGMDD